MFLGIDYGEKRIGLATGDLETKIASPFLIVENDKRESVLKKIKDICEENEIEKIIISEPAITNFHDLKTREAGSHIFITVHAVFNISISLYEAHRISDKIEEKLRDFFEGKKTHILIHMDPYDDSEMNEIEDIY